MSATPYPEVVQPSFQPDKLFHYYLFNIILPTTFSSRSVVPCGVETRCLVSVMQVHDPFILTLLTQLLFAISPSEGH